MYSSEGVLMRKITADAMAAHFPDTIVWSPDSSTVAFVATTRTMTNSLATPTPPAGESNIFGPDVRPAHGRKLEFGNKWRPGSQTGRTATPVLQPTPQAPSNVLTFRTSRSISAIPMVTVSNR
jgi:hypothetical protein